MKQLAIATFCTLWIVSIFSAQAERPTPQQIGTTVQEYWVSNQLTLLETYLTNLYASSSNFIPAIVAQVLYEGIYRNDPWNALAQVNRIVPSLDQTNFCTPVFEDLLLEEKNELEEEIAFYLNHGKTRSQLTNAAAPSAVREVWTNFPLRGVLLITNAPNGYLSVGNQGLDSVGDGIPNSWRSQFFGGDGTTTNSQSCASCDPDSDGLTNLQEYQRGTDPTNAQSKNVTLYANSVTGNNSYDGLSATVTNGHGPKRDIQAALAAAIDGDTVEIAGDQAAYSDALFSPGAKNITLKPTGTVTIQP